MFVGPKKSIHDWHDGADAVLIGAEHPHTHTHTHTHTVEVEEDGGRGEEREIDRPGLQPSLLSTEGLFV